MIRRLKFKLGNISLVWKGSFSCSLLIYLIVGDEKRNRSTDCVETLFKQVSPQPKAGSHCPLCAVFECSCAEELSKVVPQEEGWDPPAERRSSPLPTAGY